MFERRKFLRIDSHFITYYTEAKEEAKSDAGQAKNISAGGILFVTDKLYPKGTILKLKLRSLDADVNVQVVKSTERAKDLIYETRAKFINISKKDKILIQKIVDSQKEK